MALPTTYIGTEETHFYFDKAGTSTISGHIVPVTDNIQDLGTETKKYREVYTHELSTSENSLTLGDGYKISTTGNQLGILKVRDKNKLPPMITNFRDALFDMGVMFLQKYKRTQETVGDKNKIKSKIVNYVKLLKPPTDYSGSTLVGILNTVVANDDTGIYRKMDTTTSPTTYSNYTTFTEMYTDFSNYPNNSTWAYGASGHVYKGKTFFYDNNLDEIEFGKISLQQLRDFIENDVTQAINEKRSTTEGVTGDFELTAAFNSGLRFDQTGQIIGSFNPDIGEYETGEAKNFYEMSMTHDTLAFDTYNVSTSGMVSAATSSDQYVASIATDYIGITVPSSEFIDTSIDYYNQPHRLELIVDSTYYEEQEIYSMETSGSNVVIKVKNPFYLNGKASTYADGTSKVTFNIFSDYIMGYSDTFTASTNYGVIDTVYDNSNWDVDASNPLFTDITSITSSYRKKRVVILDKSLTTQAYFYTGYFITITNNNGISYDSVEIEYHLRETDENNNVYNIFILKTALSSDIEQYNTYEIMDNTYYNANINTATSALMNTYTLEDYYDPTKNTADKFSNFLMSKLTSDSSASISSGSTGVGAWRNSTIISESTYTGVDATALTTQIGNLDNLDKMLNNQVAPELFDAGELLAYNDEDYFIMYSMIPKNNFAAYTNDNYMIGFKNEPNKDPYCKLTVKGSIRSNKQIIVDNTVYEDSSSMNYLKNNLQEGAIFAQRLILGSQSTINQDVRKSVGEGGLSIRQLAVGGVGTEFVVNPLGQLNCSKITCGNFVINSNDATTSGDITLGGNLSVTGTALFTDDVTVNATLSAHTILQSSDKRLKNTIIDVTEEESNAIDQLRPVSFKWNHSTNDTKTYGFVAQEVQELYPTMVEEKEGFLRLDYIQFIPLLVKEMQQLKQANKDLQKRVEELEQA